MFCEKCGNPLPEGSKFCLNCGAKADSTESVQGEALQEAAASSAITELEAPVENQPEALPVAPPAPVQSEPLQPKPVQQVPVQPAPAQTFQQPAQPVQPVQQPVAVKKPEKILPLPVWKYMGIFILTGIPIINLIMVLVWSFGSSCNRNTKNFARAVLIFWIIGLILAIVSTVLYWSTIQYLWETFGSMGFEVSGPVLD